MFRVVTHFFLRNFCELTAVDPPLPFFLIFFFLMIKSLK